MKKTSNLKLPQFEPNDHPDFLTDFNEAFIRIDDWSIQVDRKIASLENSISVLDAEIKQLRIDVGLTNTKGGNNNE